MAQYRAQILFPPQGKMDSDSDWRAVANGNIIDAMNCRWGLKNDGTIGTVENVKGNVLLPINLPTGINKVIGGCCDYPDNRVILFLYNTESNHSILQIDMTTREVSPILWCEPALNFDDGFIMNSHVLNGILYWLNTNRELKKLIIEKAIKLTYEKWGEGIGFWILEDSFVVQSN